VPQTVLTLGNSREALTVIRSLARAGYRVIAGRVAERDPTEFSRYTAASWLHPAPGSEPEAFIEALRAFQTRQRIDYVFPIGETPMRTIIHGLSRLPSTRLVMVDAETALTCFDKGRMYVVARELGIPVPTTLTGVTPAGLVEAARRCGFPCVLKANDSSEPLLEEKALICSDEGSVADIVRRLVAPGLGIVVQSYAPGQRVNCNFAAWHGEVRLYSEQRVIRTDRPNGTGLAVDSVSMPPTPSLRQHTEALARHFQYTGVGCAQFLVDPTSGATAFLELNPRLDAACSLPVACGCDLPLWALEIARRRAGERADLPADAVYRVGLRGNWLLGDLRARARAQRSGIAGGAPAFVWLGHAMRSFLAASHHTVWSWRDPGPALFEYLGVQGKRAAAPQLQH
jgi:predicted ATP-grasp superfamily ATP-dependent carboligase